MLGNMVILMKHELVICLIIFLLLFVKLGKGIRNEILLPVIQILLLLAVIAGFLYNRTGVLFDGMYSVNDTGILQKNLLGMSVYLISLLFSDWLKRHEHMPEFMMLLLSALLGMYLMISSGNLMMFFLSLELSTIPVAAMVNFDLRIKKSSEAAMKMILSSAFSSGILLMGISFIYGVSGTIQFDELASLIVFSPLQVLAFLFLFSAFAFKLSVVPFHFWTADVYEGAPFPVAAFLSVVSKAVVSFVLMNVLYKAFPNLYDVWHMMLLGLAVLTMIVGNIFAIRQDNVKRFLAFSSIAQVGFILLAVSSNAMTASASVIYFVLIYIFSNLAAFAIAGLVCVYAQKEKISDYKSFYRNNPFLSWVMALAMFSLAGIPPTAGFFGKLFLLTSGASTGNYVFIAIAALNMVISLYYYLKVVKTIFVDQSEDPIGAIPISFSVRVGLIISAAAIVLMGFMSWVYDYIRSMA